MAEAWDDIKALKTKHNALREKLEKRKKERHGILSKIGDGSPKMELGSRKYENYENNSTIIESATETEAEVEKCILQMFSSNLLVLPIISTQIMEKLAKRLAKVPTKDTVDYILGKLSAQGAVSVQNVTIGQESGCEVIAVETTLIQQLYKEFVNENFDIKDEFKRNFEITNNENVDIEGGSPAKIIKLQRNGTKNRDFLLDQDGSSSMVSEDIMSLLALPSTREKQSKQVGEEILELLTKPTAKERSVVEKFKSHGGAQVMEFCPHGTKVECLKAQQATAEMTAKKKKQQQEQQTSEVTEEQTTTTSNEDVKENIAEVVDNIVKEEEEVLIKTEDEQKQIELNCEIITNETEDIKNDTKTNDTLASIEDETELEELPTDLCTKLHFKKIIQSHTDESLGDCSFLNTCFHMATCKYVHYEVDTIPNINTTKPVNVKSKICLKRTVDPSVTLYPPQWIQCDLRYLDMTVLGKFAVVMADPPWDIHMELPYGTMSDDEMRQLGVPALQDDGLIFLWVTGRAMELGRECLKLWGYERVDELIWVKTNQLQRIIRTGRTGHWLNHGKEHCLVGMKGNPKNLNRGLDCDVIVAEVRATSHKPDEIYGIIERLSPGTRKIELFGRPHNVQPNWITLGNQLDGIRLVDPELITQFQKRYPDGNCMSPTSNVTVPTVVTSTASPTNVKN